MCYIITKHTQLKIAEKDIPCYKIIKYDSVDRKYKAYYQNHQIYETGQTYTVKKPLTIKQVKAKLQTSKYPPFKKGLTDEVIHAYMAKLSIFEPLSIWNNLIDNEILAEFIIPKGTWYIYDNDGIEIAAPKMKFNGIVTTDNIPKKRSR